LLPKTRELFNERRPIVRQSFLSICKTLVKQTLGGSFRYNLKRVERGDMFSPVIDLEYQMARKFNPWFKAEYIPWNYTMDEDELNGGGLRSEGSGEDILIGNSASYENNHVEIFDILERHVNLSGRKLIVPLSYGGDNWYRDTIISLGKKKFGDQFIPLTTFIPNREYVALLQSCGHIIMNHLRQQGASNIAIIMLRGGKIYMNSASPLYLWLEAKGCAIGSIDAMQSGAGKKDLTRLSIPDQQKNIDVINACWGRQAQREKTQRLVEILLNEPSDILT
jgi:dTDP-N-acetylfucosamine:lipid II N-acetylfucosaminyltransferase